MANASGVFTYSSQNAVRLLSMIGQELAGSSLVFPNTVLHDAADPVTNEGQQNNDPSQPLNLFATQWYSSGLPTRAAEALAMLQIVDADTLPKAGVAIIDGGFAGPSDWQGGAFNSPDFGLAFNTIYQCDVTNGTNCGVGVAAGSNPSTCTNGSTCNWHGTQMFSVAGAAINNGYGSGGIAAPVIRPMFFKSGKTLFSAARGVTAATNAPNPPVVINMSFGVACRVLWFDLCNSKLLNWLLGLSCTLMTIAAPDLVLAAGGCAALAALLNLLNGASPLDNALQAADQAGIMTVAIAGNSSNKVEADIYVPCVMARVVCIGALSGVDGANLPVSRSSSGFGQRVNLWAPGENLQTMPTPDTEYTSTANIPDSASGTSAAAAFVSGLVADIRAIAPQLTPAQVISDVLNAGACKTGNTARLGGGNCSPSLDGKVDTGGYVDALDAIRRARALAGRPHLAPCTGGWDPDEAPPAHDSAITAVNVTPVRAQIGSTTVYAGATGDMSIHALTPGQASDPDWYRLTFNRQPGDPLAFYTTFTVTVPDPQAGSLSIKLFEGDAPRPGMVTPISPTYAAPSGASGLAELVAALRTDRTYYVVVDVTNAPVEDDNCYSQLGVEVNDPAPVPCDPGPVCNLPFPRVWLPVVTE